MAIKNRKFIGIFLNSLILIGVIFAIYTYISKPIDAAWIDESWSYRQKFTFTHNADISAERAITLSIDTAEIITAGNMQSDCDDVRFTDLNGNMLKFELTGSCNNSATTYEVVFQLISNGSNIGYVYYGNFSVASASQDVSGVTALTPSGGDPTITDRSAEEKSTGPVAFWKMDEGTDNTCTGGTNDVCNSMGNNSLNGAISNSAVWQTPDMCISGGCLLFDGTDDIVTITNTNPIDFDTGLSSGVTFQTWMKANTDGENDTGEVFDKGTNTYMRLTNEGSDGLADLEARLDLGSSDANVTVTNSIVLNRWHLVTMSYSDDGDDEITVYIDGINRGVSTDGSGSPATSDSNNLIIGGDTSNNFQGFIDEFKIYNFERSSAQVKTDYLRGSASPGSAAVLGQTSTGFLNDGLTGYWKMDQNSGDAADSSGYNLTLTNNGLTEFAKGKFDRGSEHVPASTQYFSTGGTIVGIQTISFWTNPDSNTNYFLSLTSGAHITSSSGVLSATGFSNPKIYVNGAISSTVIADVWQHIVVTSETAVDANQFYVGRQDTNYYDGTLDEVRIYRRELTTKEIAQLAEWAPGPVGYWKMDENTGSTFYDISGYGNNGTHLSTPAWTNGKYGSSMSLGINSVLERARINDPASGIFDFSNTDDYSLNVWIKVSSIEGTVLSPVQKGSNNASTPGYRFDVSNTGTPSCRYVDGDGSGIDTTGAGPIIMDGNWHYITCIMDRDGAEVGIAGYHIFVDGVLASSNLTPTETSAAGSSDDLLFGEFSGTQEFNGALDHLQIYRYARTPKQIFEDMNAGHPTGGSPIASQAIYYKLDEQQGTTANNANYMQSSLTGSISGAVWRVSGSSFCKMQGCLEFDGSDDVTTVTNVSAIDFNESLSSGFTVSTWFYADSDGENDVGQIFQKGTTTYCRTDSESGGRVDIECSLDLASTDATLNIASAVTTGSWNHLAMGYTNDTDDEITIWINGKNRGSSTNGVGSPAADANNLLIGGTTTANFDGRIDEFKVYNGELSQDEILIDANAGSSSALGGVLGAQDNEGFGGNPPVGWWSLDENTGTSSTADKSGNGQTGTLSSIISSNWIPGKLGSALNLDGGADYIDVGAGPSTVNSIAFWVYPQTTTEYFINLTSTTDYIWVNAGTITATGLTSPTIYVNGIATSTINSGVWSHVVITTSTGENASNLDIGRTQDTNYLEGRIDEVKLFDYVLTPAQVAYHYNRGEPVAHYKFDECEGATAYDSNLNNNGTITIGASGSNTSLGSCSSGTTTEAWNNGTTGKINYSLDFDGTDDYMAVSPGTTLAITADLTVSTWINMGSIANNEFLFAFSTDGETQATNSLYSLFWDTSAGNDLNYQHEHTNGTNIEDSFNVNLTTGTWYHLTLVRDATANTVELFVDGVQRDNTFTYSTDPNGGTSSYLTIGTRNALDNPTGWSDAKFDDFRIYNYALAPDQIKQVYNNGAVFFGPLTGAP